MPNQPSGLGKVPESTASGITVKIGLSANTGQTMEMSPRALARASRLLITITRTLDAAIAGHARPGDTNWWPEMAKNSSHAVKATTWVPATMTSGGISRARPLTTANCPAWVSAAARERTNQFSRGRPARRGERRASSSWHVGCYGKGARNVRQPERREVTMSHQTATPYLIVDHAARALEFYKNAFGAIEKMRIPAPGGKIGHAEITIGDSTIMLADEHPEVGALSPRTIGGSPVGIMLYVEDVDAVVKRAVAAGAK